MKPHQDDDVRLTPVAGFDVTAYARDAMSTLDLDSTRMCPRLQMDALLAEAKRSRDEHASALDLDGAVRPLAWHDVAWRVAALPLAAICALALLLLAAIRSP